MTIGRRNARIDTMRGVSILLVLLHHFNIAYGLRGTVLAALIGWNTLHAIVRNGNYAVTMFFVISGFLITNNADRRWGGLANIKPSTFYRHRAARILPCLLLLLLVVNALAALGIAIFRNQPEFGGPVSFWIVDLASLTFWMNVLMSYAGWLNYVLCVQWSLSIEEIFYLSFPILCLLLRRKAFLLVAWSVFIVIGPVWRATHRLSEYDELNSYLSCFDGIAFGCCAAILGKCTNLPSWLALTGFYCGAAFMACFYLWDSIAVTAVYGVTIMALGMAVLLVLQQSVGPAGENRFMVFLRLNGQLSYELYLFHLVILAALRTIWVPDTSPAPAKMFLLAAYLLLSFCLASVIARFYAAPLNRLIRGPPSEAATATAK
jgi:peptidoglycan/LPS O-acetylase OafA/YrhL